MSRSNVFHDLHDIFVHENVVFTNGLRVELGGETPHEGVSEVLQEALMNCVTEVGNRSASLDNDGSFLIRDLTLGLGVDTNHFGMIPNHLEQNIKVPLMFRRHGCVVRYLMDII